MTSEHIFCNNCKKKSIVPKKLFLENKLHCRICGSIDVSYLTKESMTAKINFQLKQQEEKDKKREEFENYIQ